MRDTFQRLGYHVEYSLFSSQECRQILDSLLSERHQCPLDWGKGAAASIPGWAALGRNDRLVEIVAELLGDDLILWGASLVPRRPGQIHPWHRDVESGGGDGFVSIWMGIRDTDPETSLKVIPGSHLAPAAVKAFAVESGIAMTEITDGDALEWARTFEPESRVQQLDTTIGDAVFFDGRLWHASENRSRLKTRVAVLLQYARADHPVRIPKYYPDRWPEEFFAAPRPPCLLVRGTSKDNTNRIMPGPPANPTIARLAISSFIEPIRPQPGEPGDQGVKGFRLLEGPTRDLRYLESHYSILAPGQSPHRPHPHDEEQVLIILDGNAALVVEDKAGSGKLNRHLVESGDWIHYPPNWCHTLENPSEEPLVYLTFKWLADSYHSREPLEATVVRGSEALAKEVDHPEILLEGETHYLRKLQCHITRMVPGDGYPPHADAYDIGIVLFEGTVETLGELVTAPAFIFYSAGEMHGMRNSGEVTAKYLVFELHGRHDEIYETPAIKRRRRLREALFDPRIAFSYLKRRILSKLGR